MTPARKSTVIVAPASTTAGGPADRRSLIASLRKTADRTPEQDQRLLELLADELLGST